MTRPRLLGALLTSGFLAGCTASGPSVTTDEPEIVGGRETAWRYPAVGYLAGRNDAVPFCTATLIDARHVVTAAHCLVDEVPETLVFGTGEFDRRRRRVDITRCRLNDDYLDTDDTVIYDVAYCTLAERIDDVAPMGFTRDPGYRASLLALGYGQTDEGDDTSRGPRKALRVRRVSPYGEPLLEGFERMLATRSLDGDTCYGDSGSPLLVLDEHGGARIAGILHGSAGDSDVDCAAGNLSLYAPLWPNAAFLGLD